MSREKFVRQRETGMVDCEFDEIELGDEVDLFGQRGKIVFEGGAYGVGFGHTFIDYDKLEKAIPEATGCNNSPYFTYNDNFISLWELYWNFNGEDGYIPVLKIVRKGEHGSEKG